MLGYAFFPFSFICGMEWIVHKIHEFENGFEGVEFFIYTVYTVPMYSSFTFEVLQIDRKSVV